MKKVIVTEKPSVAREFAKTLGVRGNSNGYIENDEWIITWCRGHLIEMCYPEKYDPELKKWSLDTLPFLPEEYKYEVIPDARDQFEVIKGIYHRQDIGCIYYAGDPAREGIYIQELVRRQAGTKPGVQELVVWIDSQTEEEIRRGIREAKPISAYANLIASGYERAIEDYALGINFSRVLSLKYRDLLLRAAESKKNVPIAVGRVMTCVLGMVVQREREILSFVPTQFYKPVCSIDGGGGEVKMRWKKNPDSGYPEPYKLYDESGFKKPEDAEGFIRALPGTVTVREVKRKTEKKFAPPLFNLAELQAECSKKLKISPDETLTAAQSLYEKKLTTYPRTDARVLSTAIAKEIKGNIHGLAGIPAYSDICDRILASGAADSIIKSRYTDDSKVTDHYALIPTGRTDGFDGLLDVELEVYKMIVRRFLSIFLPPAEYEKVSVTAYAGNERFEAQASVLSAQGWYEAAGLPKEDGKKAVLAAAIGAIREGGTYPAQYSVERGETKSPARYTSGSMVLAMENAGNLIEDEELRAQIKGSGIGTSATRAATITKLEKNGYLNLNKKNQVLTPAPLGDMIYETVRLNVPTLLSPEMTASWERGLEGVAGGTVPAKVYRAKMEGYIRNECGRMKSADLTAELKERIRPYAKHADFETRQWERPKAAVSGKVRAELWLDVPFDDKDEVKALGAWFDASRKAWYVPEGKDTAPFAQWAAGKKAPAKKDGKPALWLDVPFEDKDRVKALGARFDGDRKAWYVPAGTDTAPFKQWDAGKKAPAKKKAGSAGKFPEPSGNVCWLDVPFDDKDEVKTLGARFSGEKRKWYVPEGKDTAPFARWIQ